MKTCPTRMYLGEHLLFALRPVIFLVIVLLAGCDGESYMDTTAPEEIHESARKTLPENPRYDREAVYPGYIKRPLTFFTTSQRKKIAVVVYLPADENGNPINATFPTLLIQTAYNMNLLRKPENLGVLTGAPAPYFVKRGYAIVTADVQGTGISGGGWKLIGQDEQNAYGETVDWILSQEWSNGDIGVSGISYTGLSALLTAQQRPDAVKAVFAATPLGDAQRGTAAIGGLVNGVFLKTWVGLTQELSVQNLPAAFFNFQHIIQIICSTIEHYFQVDKYFIPLIESLLNGEPDVRFDGDFWRTRSPLENIDKITAPTFITGSLQDIFQRDEPLLFEQLQKNVDSRLAIYDGDHIENTYQAEQGNVYLPPMTELVLQWFDKHLMGIDSGVENIPAVTQFVKHYQSESSDGFATTTTWPHPAAAPERWYLHGDMTLTQEFPLTDETAQTMLATPPAQIEYGKRKNNGKLLFRVTPMDGSDCSVSYRQWTLGGLDVDVMPPCMYENTEVEANALNYETAPMAEDYYINGPIQADVWIDSSVTEAIVSVRIEEVSPDGKTVSSISNGLLAATSRAVDESRSRYIDGVMIQPYHFLTEDTLSPVVPGEVFKMQVEVFPASAIIRRDHRLRVSIAPSNQAQGIMNRIQRQNAQGGVTTLHISPEHPSSIVLPIVPLSELN